MFLDYDQVLEDACTLLRNNVTAIKQVIKEASDREFRVEHMPMADVRLKRLDPDNTGQQNYWIRMVIEVEINVFDMTSRAEAATIRADIANSVQDVFRSNPHFSAALDSVQVGPAEFETGEDEKQGAFIASAVLEIHAFGYSG